MGDRPPTFPPRRVVRALAYSSHGTTRHEEFGRSQTSRNSTDAVKDACGHGKVRIVRDRTDHPAGVDQDAPAQTVSGRSCRARTANTPVTAVDAVAIRVIAVAGEVSWAAVPARAAPTPCMVSMPAERNPRAGPASSSGVSLVRRGRQEARRDVQAAGAGGPREGVRAPGGGAGRAARGSLPGTARAGVLVLLSSPMSTSRLTAVTGQGLGSVGRHPKVLLDAGPVERRRAGRSVLYSRPAAGEVVAEAAGL